MKIYNNKTILITGGTGSFGSTFCKHLIKNSNPKKIIIYSRDEAKQFYMRNHFKNSKIDFFIGDIKNLNSLMIATNKVDYVFHAAAMKQVPSCENFVIDAVYTNIHGSHNLLEACFKNKVKKIIFLSTDKAVMPINAMGMTKSLMEKLVINYKNFYPSSITKVNIVRYGNVMNSRGSVIPFFIDKIKKLEELPITDKRMTRFLLSLDDAIKLVDIAIKSNDSNSIFIKKAPSAKIIDIAKVLIKHFNSNSKIINVGIRKGEKIHETLVSAHEYENTKENLGYFKLKINPETNKFDNFFYSGEKLNFQKEYTSETTQILNLSQIKKLLIKSNII